MSMPTCPSCIYASGVCKKTGVTIWRGTGCTYHIPKPQTKADEIRAMTDEELAMLFADNNCGYCRIHDYCFSRGCQINCEDIWLDWLRQEAKP